MRESTAAWYRRNATRLSLSSSLDEVVASYSGRPAVAPSVALPRGGVAFCGLGSGRRSRADSERPSSGPPRIWAVVTGAMKLARTVRDSPRLGQPTRKPRPLTEGAVRSGVSQFVSAGAGALTTLILARVLGPAGIGRYAVTIALIIGLQTFATLSLQVSIGYFVGRGTWPPRQAFATTQLAALGLGLTSVAVALLIRALFPSAFHNISVGLVLVAAASLPCALSWTFAAAVALAVDHYELYAVPQALQTTVGIVVILVLGAIFTASREPCSG